MTNPNTATPAPVDADAVEREVVDMPVPALPGTGDSVLDRRTVLRAWRMLCTRTDDWEPETQLPRFPAYLDVGFEDVVVELAQHVAAMSGEFKCESNTDGDGNVWGLVLTSDGTVRRAALPIKTLAGFARGDERGPGVALVIATLLLTILPLSVNPISEAELRESLVRAALTPGLGRQRMLVLAREVAAQAKAGALQG